jgi:hypothetical protein
MIFKNQGYLVIRLDTGLDLSSASNLQILYKKPSGVKGSYSAIAEGTKLTYAFTNADLNETGIWEFQTYLSMGGRDGYGDIFKCSIEQTLE